MSKKKLKLVKKAQARQPNVPEPPKLSPQEAAEAARFKALTAQRAARRATIYRLIDRLQRDDDPTDAPEISQAA